MWHRVRPRPLAQAAAGGGRRLHDPPTALKPLGPSPRRGHSAVVIGGFMYVFGGRQDGYPCDVASTNTNRRGLNDIDPSTPTTTFCRTEGSVGATNELWRFDPRTHTWSLLDTVRRDIGLCYIHVGGTRCVPSSTDNIMNRQARITLTVECIRTCIFFYVMCQYNDEYDQD